MVNDKRSVFLKIMVALLEEDIVFYISCAFIGIFGFMMLSLGKFAPNKIDVNCSIIEV
jgi:hypothetical protein